MSKLIPLTKGQFAIVDDEDFKELSEYKWYAHKIHYNGYMSARGIRKPKHTTIFMHRQLLGLKPGDKRQSDHKNHNTLDNRRTNLRICTNGQNKQNSRSCRNSSSQYKGVYWCKPKNKWHARIFVNGKGIHLGYFDSEIVAAKAYDRAAIQYFGEFAKLNFAQDNFSCV